MPRSEKPFSSRKVSGKLLKGQRLDIVGTQENFQKDTGQVASAAGMKDIYDPRSYKFLGGHGLATLFKTEHTLVRFESLRFNRQSLLERGLDRGAVYALIELRPGQRINFYNTHLTTDLQPNSESVRLAQVNELKAFIDRTADEGYPTVVVGDFNSARGWVAQNKAREDLGVESWDAQFGGNNGTHTWDPLRCPMQPIYELFGLHYGPLEIDLIFINGLEGELSAIASERHYQASRKGKVPRDATEYATDHALVTCDWKGFGR